MRLLGKVAIVTGAGSGFGEGMAKAFAEQGAKVVVNDINPENGQRVVEEIIDLVGLGAAVFFPGDVAVNNHMERLVASTVDEYGQLDIMVNNAGYSHRNAPMLEVPEDEFDRVFGVNCKAVYLSARHAIPVMKKQKGGTILNMASIAGIKPRPGLTWYNGSKGAIITMTRSMALELAAFNIRVNALCPVAGETGMLETFMGGDTQEHRDAFIATIPLGRLSTPKDIGYAAVFLCSDEAALITGVALPVDGGRSL